LLTPNEASLKVKGTARLKKENAALKKELNRKDKALAEMTALLVLKKSRLYLGGSQGRLISEGDKKEALALIQEAGKDWKEIRFFIDKLLTKCVFQQKRAQLILVKSLK